MIIGITGGIGSGKSYVMAYMEKTYGCLLLEADQIAYELEQPGEACYENIKTIFGDSILAPDGTIDRKILGGIVFRKKELLQMLNRIVHPAVKRRIREKVAASLAKNPERLILIEAALLLEEHYEEICEEIWYVHAEERVRRQRLKENRGYSEEKIDLVMQNQLPEDAFRERCQRRIENNGSEEELAYQIKEALKAAKKTAMINHSAIDFPWQNSYQKQDERDIETDG